MSTLGFLFQLLLVFLTLVLHECCHYLTAYLLGYSPKIGIEKNLMPYVRFQNRQRDSDNLLIALSAPLGMFGIGLLIPNVFGLQFIKVVCLLNILHLLPICSDGQVILLSIINQLKKVSS